MIPILYKQDEKEFKSEGIGHLTDAIECAVSEERNGLFELNIVYPVKGIHFDDLKAGNIILAKPNWVQDPQPFDIQSVTPSTDGMTAKIYAQNWGYRLSGIPVKPFTATGIVNALNGLISNAMIAPGFSVWTDIDNTATKFTVSHPQSFRACLGGTDGSILQTFSGSGSLEYMWDGSTVKVYRHRGQDNGVSIRYGKNLSSLKQETSIENTYTGCLAYWIDSETGKYVCSAIQYTDNHKSFAHERIYMLDASSDFNEAEPTVDQLNAKASAYIVDNDIGTPSVNLEVSFVDLSQTAEYQNIVPLERVNLCDTVHVYFPDFGVDAKAKVIKTEWNVLMDRYNSITLGDAKSNFSDTIKQEAHDAVDPVIDTTKSFLEQAIEKASELLKGGMSGHMVIGTNANGEANELFFMDTDNKATAKNVFRLNMNGWGLSTTGIDGPYTIACTIDGNFNASIINSGEINTNLIKAGVIQDAKSSNWWNLDTGEFHLSAGTKVGDSTIANKADITASSEAITTSISKTYTTKADAQSLADTAEANAKSDTAEKLKDYSTTVQMQSAIKQQADSITASVSKTYQTMDGMSSYTKKAEIITAINNDTSSVKISADKLSLVFGDDSSQQIEMKSITDGVVFHGNGRIQMDSRNQMGFWNYYDTSHSHLANTLILQNRKESNPGIVLANYRSSYDLANSINMWNVNSSRIYNQIEFRNFQYNGTSTANRMVMESSSNYGNLINILNYDASQVKRNNLYMNATVSSPYMQLANYDSSGNQTARLYLGQTNLSGYFDNNFVFQFSNTGTWIYTAGNMRVRATSDIVGFVMDNDLKAYVNSDGRFSCFNGAYSGYGVVSVGTSDGDGQHPITFGWNGKSLICWVDTDQVWSTSDARMKTNIKAIENDYLDAVGEVELKQFNFNTNPYDTEVLHFGVVAQNLILHLKKHNLGVDKLGMVYRVGKPGVEEDELAGTYCVDKEEFLIARVAYDEKRIAALEEKLKEVKA